MSAWPDVDGNHRASVGTLTTCVIRRNSMATRLEPYYLTCLFTLFRIPNIAPIHDYGPQNKNSTNANCHVFHWQMMFCHRSAKPQQLSANDKSCVSWCAETASYSCANTKRNQRHAMHRESIRALCPNLGHDS